MLQENLASKGEGRSPPPQRTENSAGRELTSEGRKHAPGRIRIPNLLIRSQVLYPVELRALGPVDRDRRCRAREAESPAVLHAQERIRTSTSVKGH